MFARVVALLLLLGVCQATFPTDAQIETYLGGASGSIAGFKDAAKRMTISTKDVNFASKHGKFWSGVDHVTKYGTAYFKNSDPDASCKSTFNNIHSEMRALCTAAKTTDAEHDLENESFPCCSCFKMIMNWLVSNPTKKIKLTYKTVRRSSGKCIWDYLKSGTKAEDNDCFLPPSTCTLIDQSKYDSNGNKNNFKLQKKMEDNKAKTLKAVFGDTVKGRRKLGEWKTAASVTTADTGTLETAFDAIPSKTKRKKALKDVPETPYTGTSFVSMKSMLRPLKLRQGALAPAAA